MMESFDDELRKIQLDLSASSVGVTCVLLHAIQFAYVCALVVVPKPDSLVWKIVAGFASLCCLLTYEILLYNYIESRWRQHIPEIRIFPRIFTFFKSTMQIGILLGFTYIDSYLKSRIGFFLVVGILCIYFHLLFVFFALRLGEDCDLITSFFAVSFTLLYDLAKENGILVSSLVVDAVLLMWFKNLLFVTPSLPSRKPKPDRRVFLPPNSLLEKINKFDKKLDKINHFLLKYPILVLFGAIVSIVVSFICAVILAPGSRSMTWWIIVGHFAIIVALYIAGLVHGVNTRWRKHIPGIRTYTYAFTLVKSIIQIGILLGFTYLDNYLKSRNGFVIVAAVVCLHVHLVCVFFAFRIGEDCDIINASLSASFTLLYELSKENGKLITWLTISAIGLMWIKNLLLLVPPSSSVLGRRQRTYQNHFEQGESSSAAQLMRIVSAERNVDSNATNPAEPRIQNGLYNPRYESLGLAIDPFLRKFHFQR